MTHPAMTHPTLSNLTAPSNLLTRAGYQDEMFRCSVLALRDIHRRNPNLAVTDRLPPERRGEWRAALGWGDKGPPALRPDWAERLAGGLPGWVAAAEQRPDPEAAFEALLIARTLYVSRRPDLQEQAAGWDRRLVAVLGRPEFALTPELLDERLAQVAGRPLPGPPPLAPPPAAAVPPPPATPPATTAPPPTPAPPAADPGLARVADRWAALSEAVRTCILLLIDAADRPPPTPT